MNYKSKIRLIGLPLVHIATGEMVDGRPRRGIAKGWVAIGDISFGILISIGGIAFGGLAFGGLAIGLIAIAGLAIGGFAIGGCAIGVFSCGGAAIALYAARGGGAVAIMYAEGGAAWAKHANTEMVKEYFENSRIFASFEPLMTHARWFRLLYVLPVIVWLVNVIRIKRR